ncbi:hypothetical protein [Mixta intestinalis]|jgi:hypothetical protein|uniref:Uncharacterized protein n=1 Tax=Mixta intestinalis TaxID=1615494 RepID=A0A6P1Q6Y7_9GAMM|nr:hypothetical protein [Mixta intestinalis]QHM73829.1 hypothetical protein C7M51_04187 [Mixta intestinalis]
MHPRLLRWLCRLLTPIAMLLVFATLSEAIRLGIESRFQYLLLFM